MMTTTPIHDAARTLLGNDLSPQQVADLNMALAEQPVALGGEWKVGYGAMGDVASIETVDPGVADLSSCRWLACTLARICPIPHALLAVHVPTMTAHDLHNGTTMRVIPPGDDCECGGFDIDMGDT